MLDTNNHSIHYKMYKSGKSWVFAGLISAGLLLSFGGETAFADTPSDSDSTATQTEQVSPEKPVVQPDQTTLSKSSTDSDPAPAQDPEDNNPTEPENSQPDNAPAPSDDPDKNITPQDNEETNPSNLHKNNYSTSGGTTDSLNKTPGGSDVPPIKQTAPERPQPRLAMAPGAPTPVPAAAPVAVTAPIAEDDESIDVWMPNKTLQALVANQLHKSVDSLTKDDMASLTTLAATHKQYSPNVFVNATDSFDLTGLELATNLTYLDLSFDPTVDFSSFPNKPRSHWGDVTSLEKLSGLTNLQTLILAHNRITDISPLGNLKNLKVLDLSDNLISDFSMLDASQFTSLSIDKQLVTPDTVHFIDPKNPTLTLSQLMKLPQNFNGQYKQPFDQDDRYARYTRLVSETATSENTLTGNMLFYRSGTKLEDYKVLDDTGTVQFTNIHLQNEDYIINYSDWTDIFEYPGVTPIQHPYQYYLRANLQVSYTPTGSTNKKNVYFTVFIPYANPEKAANLTVHYVDMASNKPIQADKIITDKLTSDTYDLTAEQTSVKGYTFDHADGALTGNFTADPLTVTLYFTKDPTKPVTPVTPPVVTPTTQTTVTAHYVDQNGKTVHADQVLTGHAGDSYSTTAFTIPGYDLTTTPENASGTFGDTDTTVTYVYRDQTSGNGVEVNIDPADPAQPAKEEPTTGDQAATIHHPGSEATNQKGGAAVRVPATTLTNQKLTTPVKSVAASSASKTTLPQTNEHRVTPLLGIVLLLGTFLGFGLKRKQH
ncbi:MucBP domain-containing protein [Levilactobacillus mulengensis]|uniref:MucBP domain-containing protein n=1 Tax=Levilactobacillus mulengensis TaxID=2486025 RepID=UPI000F784534|nr:MucBP domain-containing protein [Levilactobacillus mulengensis]